MLLPRVRLKARAAPGGASGRPRGAWPRTGKPGGAAAVQTPADPIGRATRMPPTRATRAATLPVAGMRAATGPVRRARPGHQTLTGRRPRRSARRRRAAGAAPRTAAARARSHARPRAAPSRTAHAAAAAAPASAAAVAAAAGPGGAPRARLTGPRPATAPRGPAAPGATAPAACRSGSDWGSRTKTVGRPWGRGATSGASRKAA